VSTFKKTDSNVVRSQRLDVGQADEPAENLAFKNEVDFGRIVALIVRILSSL
jgi:hypothetical protein